MNLSRRELFWQLPVVAIGLGLGLGDSSQHADASPFVTSASAPSSSGVGSVVGVWSLMVEGAPFRNHLFTFHADGTMITTNPDAGDPNSSDSDGMGIWTVSAPPASAALPNRLPDPIVDGKFREIMASRETRELVGTLEVVFSLHVVDNTCSGTALATFYDPDGQRTGQPLRVSISGSRMVLG